ncbi:MAG: hypothetical protein RIC95_00325 [Vicingaceae bacterium]
MKKIFTILVVSFLLLSCDEPKLQRYYFQMDDFSKSKTYIYVDQNKPDNIIHFKMYYKIVDSDTIFTSEALNPDGTPIEVFVEKIDDSKSTMTDYYFVYYDSQGKKEDVFSDKIKTEVYSYKQSSYPLVWKVEVGTQTFTKKRSILKMDSTIEVLGHTLKCIVFKDEFKIEDENGLTEFFQESYYADGMGMIGYKRFISDDNVMDYKLKEIK